MMAGVFDLELQETDSVDELSDEDVYVADETQVWKS